MAKSNRISLRPSDKEQGGGAFNIAPGSECEITDAEFTTWRDAGESALKGGREADDPCIKLVMDVKDADDPKVVHLGLGKANRLQPSRDGEFLEPADGSSAKGLPDGANGTIFMESLTDTKAHGKKALPEEAFDDGVRKALVGLRFLSGSVVPKREFSDDGDGRQRKGNRPTLIAEEILELPGSSSKSSSRSSSKKDEDRPSRGSKKDEDEDTRGKKRGGKDDDEDEEEVVEQAVMGLLEENPKYRKGLPFGDAYRAVYAVVKKREDAEKLVDTYVQDEKWMQSKKRPWGVDEKNDAYVTP